MATDTIKILITGDFCPINRIEELALNQDFGAIFNDFTDVLSGNDLNIIDLECPLTKSVSARKKIGPHQKAHPDCIQFLTYANVNLAAMANNHIMDYGIQGIIDTVELCKANKINTVGIGKTSEDAAIPFSADVKGKRIAILNFTDDEFITAPGNAFMCNPLQPVQMLYDIADAKNHHDYVIVIVHAGNEFYELPSPRTKKLYRFIIDIGADAVISHHTHVFSGYEIYKSKPIFYGLGNFIYDWPGKSHENWNKGYLVRLLLSKVIEFEIVPLKQGNERPGVYHLNKEETEAFQLEMERLNLIIVDDNSLHSEFIRYCHSVFPMYDAFIEPNFGKYVAFLRKRGMFPRFLSHRKRLFLLNLARCESHRDVLIRMLSKYE